MQKIQKFGGAMFTPVLLFAFAGISVGIGTLFTTQAIMGGLAAPTSMWYKCWNVFLQGGWTVFNQYHCYSQYHCQSEWQRNKMQDVAWKH